MGTGVVSSIFSALAKNAVFPAFSAVLAQVFMFVAILVAIPVLGITAWRWIKYPADVAADLKNPVKGAMFATFAGGFLVLGTAFSRAGVLTFGLEAATLLTYIFTAIGTALALVIGMVFLTDIFARGDVKPPLITGAWFIPPVVTIIVPTALGPLLNEPTPLNNELYWISWALLGVGTLLYVIVVAALFFRSATQVLPPAPLAPTLIIGMGPAGLIALDLLLLQQAATDLGMSSPGFAQVSTAAATMLWAFGFWWGIAAFVVIRRGHGKLPFGLPWWGFTFPVGAWVVSGINLGYEVSSWFVVASSLLGAAILIGLWFVVAWKTVRGVLNKTIWDH